MLEYRERCAATNYCQLTIRSTSATVLEVCSLLVILDLNRAAFASTYYLFLLRYLVIVHLPSYAGSRKSVVDSKLGDHLRATYYLVYLPLKKLAVDVSRASGLPKMARSQSQRLDLLLHVPYRSSILLKRTWSQIPAAGQIIVAEFDIQRSITVQIW